MTATTTPAGQPAAERRCRVVDGLRRPGGPRDPGVIAWLLRHDGRSYRQIEYSLVSRGIEEDILPTCRELGVGVTAYGVLSRGLLGGHWSRDRALAPGDFRRRAPRFSEENLDRNLSLVERLRGVADKRDATLAQLAIAWVLARGDDIVPLVGARTRERLEEALGALDVELDPQAVAELEEAVPAEAVAGERYNPQQMALLDSEYRSSRA